MTAKASASKKAKGSRLEHLVARRFTEVLGVEARRMPLSGAVNGFESDIATELPLAIEVKNQETWSVGKWWKQTTDQCKDAKIPVLVMGKNRMKDPLVVISFTDFLFFLELARKAGWGRTRRVKKARTI